MHTVIHVSRFSFTDSATGRSIRGCKIVALGKPQEDADSRGRKPATMSAPYELFDCFKQIPGDYHLDLNIENGRNGSTKVSVLAAHPAQKAS